MSRNYLETLVGFLVLIIAIMFAYYAYKGADPRKSSFDSSYTLNVSFARIDGLNIGGDVRLSGLKVGSVEEAAIDPETYRANVKLKIDSSIKVPDDSSAEIISSGLLGDKYVSLVPGGSDTMLADGGKIKFSQASVSLEALIGKFMFGGSDDKKQGDSNSSAN